MRPMPEGFTADARILTHRQMMQKYRAGPVVLARWLDEIDFHRGRGKHRRPVAQYDADTGGQIAVYPSISDAGRAMYGREKNNIHAIWACCNGKTQTAAGFVWRYYEERKMG